MLGKMSTFFYLGFGSNLLKSRIQISNKSAERFGMGVLHNYQLDFADSKADEKYYSSTWNGSPATIIETKGSVVYGAVWKIDRNDMDELDKQEGVELGLYKPINVQVLVTVNDLQLEIPCRTYQLVSNPAKPLNPLVRPFERQPSKTYLNVILNGAEETQLPASYIAFLKSFKHNNKLATNENLVLRLGLKDMLL